MVIRTSQANQQGFPQLSAPLTDVKTGVVLQPWLQFFTTLWARTGAGQGAATSPTGATMGWMAATPPTGWLICDGAAVSRTIYSVLFAIIGTTFGAGDGSTTFNLPDARGRMLIGVSGGHALGTTGGAESVTLSVGQLPSHTHAVTDPGHFHTALVGDTSNTTGIMAGSSVSGSTSTDVTGITIDNTGSGNSVPTISPFLAAHLIIKT
jgi:microcystin-dependent protein